jgi:hypothetical protein
MSDEQKRLPSTHHSVLITHHLLLRGVEMAEEGKSGKSKKFGAVIDRIEDNEMAVVLVGENDGQLTLDVPTSLLPEGASDGDHLHINITLDKESRRAAEDSVRALQERLSQRSGTEGKKDFKL